MKFLSVFIAPSEMMKNKFYLGPFVSSHITLAKFQFNRKTSQLDFEALNLCLKNCKSFHMHNISTPSRKSKLMSLTHLRPMFDLGRTRYSIDDLHLYLKCHSFTGVFQPFKKKPTTWFIRKWNTGRK